MLYSPSNAGGGSGQHATALGQSMPPTYATALTSSGSGLAAPGHVGTMSAAGAFPISAFASPASVPALTAALHHHRLQQLHHLQQQHLHHHHHHHHSAGLMMTSAAAAHSATGTSLPLPSAETATDLVLKKMSGFSVSDILERESDPMGKDGGSQPLLPVAVPKTAACVVITSSRTSANAGHCSGGGMSVDDNLRPLSGYTSSPPPLPTHPSPGNSSVSSSPPPPAYFSPGSLSSSVNRCPVARESRELKFGMERILSNELAPPKGTFYRRLSLEPFFVVVDIRSLKYRS